MFNIAAIQGNLTDEPVLKQLESGTVVANFAIANNQKYKDQDKTCFINCILWGKQAEALTKHAHKGTQIIVEGQIQQENWTDRQTEQQRSRHVLNGTRFHFCGPKTQQQTSEPPPATPATATVPSATVPVTTEQQQPVATVS